MEVPQEPARRARFRMASTHESLERLVEEAQDFAGQYADDEELAYRLVLCTSEAVTNAIEHGNGADPERHVQVDLYALSDRLEVVVEDEGEGFDRAALQDPLAGANRERAHGRGVFIMEQMADEVAYEAGGHRVRLYFMRDA